MLAVINPSSSGTLVLVHDTKFLQVLLTSNDPILAFHWLLVIWVSSFFLPLLLLLYLCGLCVGVDNALIKGEIVDTWLICAHVVLCDE